MNIVVMGPQGSGKGTQSELLSKRFNLAAVSTGALYRKNIKEKNNLGKLAEKFTLKGIFGPNYLTNGMMKSELIKPRYRKGVILDGYPRNLAQAKFLEKLRNIDLVILIDISQKEALKRLGGRRVCNHCGETAKTLKNNTVCDKCGGKLMRRPDDYPKAIRKRLNIYQHETKPVVDYYKKQKKLIKINGEGMVDQVFSAIKSELKKKGIK